MSEQLLTQAELRAQRVAALKERLMNDPAILQQRSEQLQNGVKDMPAPKSNTRAAVKGIVVNKFNKRGSRRDKSGEVREIDECEVDIMVLSPTSEYAESGETSVGKGEDERICHIVHKETDTLEIVVNDSSDGFKKNCALLRDANKTVDSAHPRSIMVKPCDTLSLKFEGTCADIPHLSIVTFGVSASAWVPNKLVAKDGKPAPTVAQTRAFLNGSDLTLDRALSGDEWVTLVKSYPSMAVGQMPRLSELIAANEWTSDSRRKYARQVFCIPLPRSNEFAVAMSLRDDVGSGTNSKLIVDESDKKSYGKSNRQAKPNDPLEPALRFRATVHAWKDIEAYENDEGSLHQLASAFWETTEFGVANIQAWPLLGPKIVPNVDIVAMMRVDLQKSNGIPSNHRALETLGPKDALGEYFMQVLGYKVGLGRYLLKRGIPVSQRVVASWIKNKYSFFGAPCPGVAYSLEEDGTAVRTLSEMGYGEAAAFVGSEAGKEAYYRVLCVPDANAKTTALISNFVNKTIGEDGNFAASLEDQYREKGFPLLEALLDPDFDQESPGETRKKFFGADSSDSDPSINHSATHILQTSSARSVLGTSDVQLCADGEKRPFFYIFAIDATRVNNNSVSTDVKLTLGAVVDGAPMLKLGAPPRRAAIEAAPVVGEKRASAEPASPEKRQRTEEPEADDYSAPMEEEEEEANAEEEQPAFF